LQWKSKNSWLAYKTGKHFHTFVPHFQPALSMTFLQIFTDYGVLAILTLAMFSFIAGFIDAVAGGGGLIQLPALLVTLPNTEIPTLFGTNKIAGLAGTSVAASQYARRIKFDYKILLTISFFTAIASFLGAKTLHYFDSNSLKPLILIILVIIAIYTFLKKDLGSVQTKELSQKKQMVLGSILGLTIGFYDGFFGPGTGSFLMLGFVVLLGFEFVQASAYSKFINCIANIAALVVFIRNGNYIVEFAIIMAICNVAGNFIGSRTALKRGNGFVRVFFLIIVSMLILRFGYDILS
jgi:uncharacterized membrane protein YfcA